MQIGFDATASLLPGIVLWAQQDRPGGLPIWPVLILIGIMFYFLLIRPELSSRKRHEQMLKDLKPGDEVVTIGGLVGKIVSADSDTFTIRLDDNVRVKVLRSAIARLYTEKLKEKESK